MLNVVFTVGLLLGGCGVAATFTICHSYMQKRAKRREQHALQKDMSQAPFAKDKNEWEERMTDKLIERLLSQEQSIKGMEEEIRLLKMSKRLTEVEAEEKRKCQISNLKEEWGEKRSKWEEERLRLIREKEALSQKLVSTEQQKQSKPARSNKAKIAAAAASAGATESGQAALSRLEEKIRETEKERRDERHRWEQERLQLVRKEDALTQMFLSAEKRNEEVKRKMEAAEDKLLRMQAEMSSLEEKRREEQSTWEEERAQLVREKETFSKRSLDAQKDARGKAEMATTANAEMRSVRLQNKWTNNVMGLGDKWEEQRLQLIKEMGALAPTFLSAAQKIKDMEEEEEESSSTRLAPNKDSAAVENLVLPPESNRKATHVMNENQAYPMHPPDRLHYVLSESNRKAAHMGEGQAYSHTPDRLRYFEQVLSEGLTGHCYWEVVWSGWVSIAVAYRGCSDCHIGNDKSWTLECQYGLHHNNYTVCHKGKRTVLSARPSGSNRVGVYLDWPAGILSFNRVTPVSVTHLYTFYCKFTEPLYPGFWFGFDSSVYLCQMKEVLWS